ncbi:MAG: hypothetical protein AB1497_09540 [Bacillota bacterium]
MRKIDSWVKLLRPLVEGGEPGALAMLLSEHSGQRHEEGFRAG